MDAKNTAHSITPDGVSSRNSPQRLSPAIVAEVERLLAGRTRDIRLDGELAELFLHRSWPQTAKIMRAWFVWVAVIDILVLGVNALLLPAEAIKTMLLPAGILAAAALATAVVFVNLRSLLMRRIAVLAGLAVILLCMAFWGAGAGGEFYERHLTIMLFVAVTAIIIFPSKLEFTAAVGGFALGLYLVFQMRNPGILTGSALAGTLFFSIGVAATVVARRTANILAHKTFLLELRDRNRLADLLDANKKLEFLAGTDPLTGIANRRSMAEALDRYWAESMNTAKGAGILMCDIDHFKRLNDSLGHAEGDRSLVEVAAIIRRCLRDGVDQVSRYGGEEFLVLLPGSGEQDAMRVAERIRSEVEAAALPNPTSGVIPCVTVSIGIAVSSPDCEAISAEKLQHRADMALYWAKENGRNRSVLYRPEIEG